MYYIILAGFVIAIILIISQAVVSVNNRQRKKKADELVARLSLLAERNNLTISKKELLENSIIGLDELRRKLFVLRKTENNYVLQIIDLLEIKNCAARKMYKRINRGIVKKEKCEARVDKIVLVFEYLKKYNPVQIPFYESGVSDLCKAPEMEIKAGNWETVLTETINRTLRNTG